MNQKISIGGDHAGYELKEVVIRHLEKKDFVLIDRGPHSDKSVDYPDFVHPVCNDILEGRVTCGILICGSGNGVAITANKYQGIRCGLCWKPELAALTKQHNNANVLALPARFIDANIALEIVDTFLSSLFEAGRHKRRVDKMIPGVEYLC